MLLSPLSVHYQYAHTTTPVSHKTLYSSTCTCANISVKKISLQLASPPLTGDYLHFPYPQTPLLFSTSTPRDMTSFQDFEELEGLESTHSDNEANQQHPNYVPRSAEIYGAHTTPNYPYNAEASPENQAYWSNGSVPHNAPTRMLPLDHSRVSSAYPVIPWGHSPSSSTSTVSHASPSFAFTRYGPDETAQHNLGNYSSVPSSSPASHRSRSSELVLSPYARSSHLISPPTTPGYIYGMPQPEVSVVCIAMISVIFCVNQFVIQPNMDGYREQQRLFKEALQLPMVTIAGPFVPQKMYMPHTNSDRRRYVEETELQTPIYFWMQDPVECGIPLIDALHSRVRRLQARDETVFEGRGPSISVRLQVRNFL